MKKIILFYNVIVISVITIIGFADASSISQLVSAIFFFPLAAYFWLLIIPTSKRSTPQFSPSKKSIDTPLKSKNRQKHQLPELTALKEVPRGKFDLNRRMFLRLIGSAGVSVFILSIFTNKAEAAFFGSVPGPGTVGVKDVSGNLIDPSEKQPTDGYNITEVDDSTPTYIGYVNKDGAWYILKEDSSGAYRYTKGTSSFSTNWTNRASLTYDYFSAVF